MLKIARFILNMFGVNTYVVYDPETKQAIVVDPGMVGPEEFDAMMAFLTKNDLKVTQIVNTHLHLDHCFGIAALKQSTHAPLAASPLDADLGKGFAQQMQKFGLPSDDSMGPVEIDRPLKDGDEIGLGSGKITIIAVPGHTQGGLALYCKKEGWVITGDSLFQGSIGRTDLPGGDYATLVNAVKNRLLTLPDDTVVYPGHGDPTTIGREKGTNPFLK